MLAGLRKGVLAAGKYPLGNELFLPPSLETAKGARTLDLKLGGMIAHSMHKVKEKSAKNAKKSPRA
jgi:hypothetical protein